MSQGEDRIERLEEHLRRVEERLARLEDELPEDAEAREELEELKEELAVDPDEDDAAADEDVEPEPVVFDPEEGVQSPEPAGREPDTRSFEERLGADWLAKAGMVVLVLGVAFFLKYAFDNDWIGPTGRIWLGIVGGLGLVAAGDLLHSKDRYGAYPQVLAGGGASIVYFALYAAYAFEEYRTATGMSLELDSFLLGATALALVGYATLRGFPTLAGLAVALGAITALVAETFDAFSVFYIVTLAAAVTGAAAYRRWANVTLAALVASHVTLGIDLALGVEPAYVLLGTALLLGLFTVAALRTRAEEAVGLSPALAGTGGLLAVFATLRGDMTTFSVLYAVALAAALAGLAWRHNLAAGLVAGTVAAVSILAAGLTPPADVVTSMVLWGALAVAAIMSAAAWLVSEREAAKGLTSTTLVSALSLLAALGLFLWGLTLEDLEAWRGPATLVTALAGLGLGLIPQAPKHARAGWLGAGTIAALAWPPIQFDGAATATAWACLLILAAAVRLAFEHRALRAGMLAAAGLLAGHLALDEVAALEQDELGRAVGLLIFLAAAVGYALAWWTERQAMGEDLPITRLMLAGAVIAPLAYVGAALDGYTISIWWALFALALVAAGFALDEPEVRVASLAVFGLVLGRIFLVDMAEVEVVVRIITFLVVGAILLGASFLYARAQGSPSGGQSR